MMVNLSDSTVAALRSLREGGWDAGSAMELALKIADAVCTEKDRICKEEDAVVARRAALPAGFEEKTFISIFCGTHTELCADEEEVVIGVPAGMPTTPLESLPGGGELYHTDHSRGNWRKFFAGMPGCVVWNGEEWVSPEKSLENQEAAYEKKWWLW